MTRVYRQTRLHNHHNIPTGTKLGWLLEPHPQIKQSRDLWLRIRISFGPRLQITIQRRSKVQLGNQRTRKYCQQNPIYVQHNVSRFIMRTTPTITTQTFMGNKTLILPPTRPCTPYNQPTLMALNIYISSLRLSLLWDHTNKLQHRKKLLLESQ